MLDLLQFYASWKSLIPLIGIFSVDTFLAMSGFLMTYTFFKKMNKKANFSIYQYYIHRYIRLTAPVAVVLAIMMYVYPSIGSGPRWDWFLSIFVMGIKEKWWSILLYLQNYIDTENLCVLHLWSLAVDMQLYWISPLILYPLYRRPKLGITIALALCVASIVASGVIVALNQYPAIYATHEPNMELIMREFRDVYITTHTRASPWCIGIIFGYAVVTKTKRPSKAAMWCGWLATISALIFCLYSSRYFTDTNYVYDIVREVIFASLARPAWAFAVCWLVYASAHDCAGPITNILSWKFFQPLSRLSYCIYLVHVAFPLARASTTRTPTFFHDYVTWQSCICDLFLSVVMAWGVSITFEVPILALEDMIINLKAARSRERKDE